MKILVTGAAGFIGYHLIKNLVEENHDVYGLDIINDYYDVKLKYKRLRNLGISKNIIEEGKIIKSNNYNNFKFVKQDIKDREYLPNLFKKEKFEIVCNLAAQAGVRYSIENPETYVDNNIVGFLNILECCRYNNIKHLIYASSSSVYGGNEKIPFSEDDNVDTPVSLYAATKKSNELMASVYSHLYKLKSTGLRFFTVYGPYGRPDMAPILFSDAIINDLPIQVFNNGNLSRDFTYVDDIIKGIISVVKNSDLQEKKSKIYNLGCGNPIKLLDFIHLLEVNIGKSAIKKFKPMQPGDVYTTYADMVNFKKDFNYKPLTSINNGVKTFVEWYLKYIN